MRKIKNVFRTIRSITIFVLQGCFYKKYIKYAIYQLMIVLISFIPIILIAEKMIQPKALNKIAIGVSILNLVISLSLGYKDIKETIIRKFHL